MVNAKDKETAAPRLIPTSTSMAASVWAGPNKSIPSHAITESTKPVRTLVVSEEYCSASCKKSAAWRSPSSACFSSLLSEYSVIVVSHNAKKAHKAKKRRNRPMLAAKEVGEAACTAKILWVNKLPSGSITKLSSFMSIRLPRFCGRAKLTIIN